MHKKNENKISTIKSRVVELIENKNIAKEYFFTKIGMTSASFRGNAQNTPLNSTAIENILSEFPDLNIEWLLTGKGDMLKENEKKTEIFSEGNVSPKCKPKTKAQNDENVSPKVSPIKKSLQSQTSKLTGNFVDGGWSDVMQIEILNRHIAAQDELLESKDQTIAAQKEVLKLLEGQINASTALMEKFAAHIDNEPKKRSASVDVRTASDVAAKE